MGTDVSTPLHNHTLNAHANISSRARGLQFHPYFVRVANALASLCICSGSSEYSLIDYAARTKMMMMIFSYTDGVPRPLAKLHTRHTQFYAPTEAFMKEFWLYPAIIIHLFALSTGQKSHVLAQISERLCTCVTLHDQVGRYITQIKRIIHQGIIACHGH